MINRVFRVDNIFCHHSHRIEIHLGSSYQVTMHNYVSISVCLLVHVITNKWIRESLKERPEGWIVLNRVTQLMGTDRISYFVRFMDIDNSWVFYNFSKYKCRGITQPLWDFAKIFKKSLTSLAISMFQCLIWYSSTGFLTMNPTFLSTLNWTHNREMGHSGHLTEIVTLHLPEEDGMIFYFFIVATKFEKN